MDADANLYQDVTEIVDADADVIQVPDSAETTAVYGLFYFSFSAADAAVTHGAATAAVAAAMTAVCGLSFFSSSAADAAVTHGAEMAAVVDATTAANDLTFKDGLFRPFFMQLT